MKKKKDLYFRNLKADWCIASCYTYLEQQVGNLRLQKITHNILASLTNRRAKKQEQRLKK